MMRNADLVCCAAFDLDPDRPHHYIRSLAGTGDVLSHRDRQSPVTSVSRSKSWRSLTIDIDGKKTEWTIVGTYSITGNVSPPLLYVNYEYLSVLVGEPEMAYSMADHYSPARLCHPGTHQRSDPQAAFKQARHSDPAYDWVQILLRLKKHRRISSFILCWSWQP